MKVIELYDKFEPIFGLIVQGYNLFDKYQSDRHREIVTSFHSNILDGNETEEKINYEKENIKVNQEDYYILLKNAVEDEEKEKVYIYSNLFKFIRDNQHIEKDLKRFLIRNAKDLPYSSIKLIPEIYIYMNFHTKYLSFKEYKDCIYKKLNYDIKRLDQSGIISILTGITFDNTSFDVNEIYFNNVVKSFFYQDDLLPEKYHIEIWKEKKALIITDDSLGKGLDIDKLIAILNDISIPYESQKCMIGLKEDFSHYIFNFDNHENISAVFKNAEKIERNNKIIKISFKFQAGKNDVLNLNDSNDINKFKELFSN